MMRPSRSQMLSAMLLAAAVLVGFVAFRQFGPKSTISAGPESVREPLWYVAELEEEEALPRFDGSILGIRIGPDVDMSNKLQACPGGYEHQSAAEEASNSPLSPFPGDLPPQSSLVDSLAVLCDSEVVSAEATYWVEPAAGRLGGNVSVYRFRGEPIFRFNAAAERVREVPLGAGVTAVLVVPLSPDGLGQSAIFVNEPWGLTIVRSTGIPASELIQVAESLIGEGGRE